MGHCDIYFFIFEYNLPSFVFFFLSGSFLGSDIAPEEMADHTARIFYVASRINEVTMIEVTES